MSPAPASARRPRILIVRLSAIGDVIHGLPVLNALRRAWPEAWLGWVVEGRAGDLLEGHPALDRLFRVPRRWLASWREVMRLRTALRAEHFEITLDLQGLSKSAIAAWLSGAPRRLGLAGPDARELAPWLNTELVRPTAVHIIDRTRELLDPLGLALIPAEFNLPRLPAADTFAANLGEELFAGAPFAVINPGAGWPSKRWPRERFAQVARHLKDAHQLSNLVVWAGAEERAWAEEIVAGAAGAAKLAPPTDLAQLTALLRRARIFVGSDTGPLHLAAAVGTPCVGLFGPMPAERNGPYGSGHIALQNQRLTGTSRQRRTASTKAMETISAAEVGAACDQLLARNRE